MSKLKKILETLVEEKSPKIDVAKTFIWYHFATYNDGLTLNQINDYFSNNNLTKYNLTYLKNDLKKSRDITKDNKTSTYKPLHGYIKAMELKYVFVKDKPEDVITEDTIIPDILVENTRGYIKILSSQINGSYHYNIFDGCAVLMRRLLEILLVHSYESNGKITDIKDGDDLKNLSYIINYTISNKPFNLSKEVLGVLNDFRELGNFSAHKVQFNCKRRDIDNVKLKYRLAVEELLYSAKIKT